MLEKTNVAYMSEFPDWEVPNFDMNEYNSRFINANVIINAKTTQCSYPPHWGPLSLKSSFQGEEYYRKGNSFYLVDPSNYLIFNEAKSCSSYIDSKVEVNSFTINFSPSFEKSILQVLFSNPQKLLDEPFYVEDGPRIRFMEKLYQHNNSVSPLIAQLKAFFEHKRESEQRINELLIFLLENMVLSQHHIHREIRSLASIKSSTKIELYKRLIRAKDFIYSSYSSNLTLEEISNVACLNQHYFLRQFRNTFNITPFQYLTQRRLEVASGLLKSTQMDITQICSEIGYSDLASFSRLFKRNFGSSPLIYKKSLLN